ncbi:MAG: hypothetical protein JWL98_1354 [Xanthomonadaceae bacterium]|nr:hypothetical protein [Xanthomonadaceae bacterium]
MGQLMRHARLAAMASVVVFALVLLAQLPLIANPGYLSHDELQWAAFAGHHGQLPWLSWTRVDVFQYRPLTFNLWLWASRHLFGYPYAFHAVVVGWGAANAAMTCALARRFGIGTWPAACGALLFALGPYAAYVHGWVATMADLAWVSCALLTGLLVRDARSALHAALTASALTLVGLLAKEAAIAIPALLALAWWFDGRTRNWRAATIASGLVAALYLVLRVGPLLHAAREGGFYTPGLQNIGMRWLEYQLFALLPQKFEVATTFVGVGGSVVAAALLWGLLMAALLRTSQTLAAVYLLGGIAALLPVLLLGNSANQYAYGSAALTAMTMADTWPHAPRWGRTVIALVAAITLWHGINVMRELRHAGQLQAVFSPALATAAKERPGLMRLHVTTPADAWRYQRLTHAVPSYRGVAIGERVQLVDGVSNAEYSVLADGRLAPLR